MLRLLSVSHSVLSNQVCAHRFASQFMRSPGAPTTPVLMDTSRTPFCLICQLLPSFTSRSGSPSSALPSSLQVGSSQVQAPPRLLPRPPRPPGSLHGSRAMAIVMLPACPALELQAPPLCLLCVFTLPRTKNPAPPSLPIPLASSIPPAAKAKTLESVSHPGPTISKPAGSTFNIRPESELISPSPPWPKPPSSLTWAIQNAS